MGDSLGLTIIGIALWALIPGFVAKRKGRSFFAYYFLCFLVTPLVSMIITLVLKPIEVNEKQSVSNNPQISGFNKSIQTNDAKVVQYEELEVGRKKESVSRYYTDELRELKSLLDDEVITPEEFDKKKKEILGFSITESEPFHGIVKKQHSISDPFDIEPSDTYLKDDPNQVGVRPSKVAIISVVLLFVIGAILIATGVIRFSLTPEEKYAKAYEVLTQYLDEQGKEVSLSMGGRHAVSIAHQIDSDQADMISICASIPSSDPSIPNGELQTITLELFSDEKCAGSLSIPAQETNTIGLYTTIVPPNRIDNPNYLHLIDNTPPEYKDTFVQDYKTELSYFMRILDIAFKQSGNTDLYHASDLGFE